MFVDDEKDKRKKPILSYSQPITDSRNRILGAREEGEAGAFSRLSKFELKKRKNGLGRISFLVSMTWTRECTLSGGRTATR